MKKSFLISIFLIFSIHSNLFSHGIAVHINQYEKVLQFYLEKYGAENPYYLVMLNYPEFVKYGATLPDLMYVNAGKPTLQNLYKEIREQSGKSLTYEIDLDEVPDPSDPQIGTNSFGIDTHDRKYAFMFAQYLLDQANLEDPPGIDPGGTGFSAVSRGQKLALAIGYYLHLCQDIIGHNFWVPKLTAQSSLAELSLIEPKSEDIFFNIIPGIQTHHAIESMHDYRLGKAKCQAVADLIYDQFWIAAGNSNCPVQVLDGVTIWGQLEPPVGYVYYPASPNGQDELYAGLNPAIHFFWKVLQDWHQNNPYHLPADYKTGPLISLDGLVNECHIWRFMNRYYTEIVGYGNFPNVLAEWIGNHTDPYGLFTTIQILNLFVWPFNVDALNQYLTDYVKDEAKPIIREGVCYAFQSYLGIMINDPSKAEELALDPTTPINYSEYQRLKTNPLFMSSNFFDGFSYLEDLGITYFDLIGPDGYLYSDWTPEYYYTYFWGVLNSLNGITSEYEQRFDIGVFDAYFMVNDQRYGPGVEIIPFEGNNFKAIAELYALENMTSSLQITAKVKLDHINNSPVFDYTVKTMTFFMQQNPADYNINPRTSIEIPFSSADMAGLALENYRGVYLELSVNTQTPFYTTDWKQYAALSQVANNRRYKVYDTYTKAPYSYPQNYIWFKFINLNPEDEDIGSTININNSDINSNEPIPIYFAETVNAIAKETIVYEGKIHYKHHDWCGDFNDFYLKKIFPANASPYFNYHIYFQEQDTITLNCAGGSVYKLEIRDPWFVEKSGPEAGKQLNRFHSFDEDPGFNGINYYVFLRQFYYPDHPNYPYYLLKAPEQNHNNIQWYFQNWEGNGVVFGNTNSDSSWVSFESPNASVTANYKGHMAANSSRATGSNNGRRLARCGSNLYLVYEDLGEIWFTHSSNNGATWDREELLASPAEGAQVANPAITLYMQKLFVTWVELYECGQNNDNIVVWFSEKDISMSASDWISDIVWVEDLCELSEKIPAPSIAVLNVGWAYQPVIFYDHNRNNVLKIRGFERVSGEWCEIGNLNINGSNPSLSADTYHQINNEYLGLVYDHNGVIYLQTCYNQDGGSTWQPAEVVSQEKAWIRNQSHPNISLINTHAHVTWEAFNSRSGHQEVKYREYLPSSAMSINSEDNPPISPYNVVTTFGSNIYDLHHPTVGSDEDQNVSVYYQKTYQNSRQIFKKKYTQSSAKWQAYYYEGGQYPSITDHALEGCIWTKASQAPFLLITDASGPSSAVPVDPITKPGGPQINSLLEFTYILEPDENDGQTGYITCSIDNTIFNGDSLLFNDSLYTDFTVAEISQIPLDLEMRAFHENVKIKPNDQEILFKIEFIDRNQNLHMTKLKYHELPDSGSFIKSVSISNLHYREGRVRIIFPKREPIISYNFEYSDNGLPKQDHSDLYEIIPQNYFISQNFPNPFNPITHITFGLRDEQQVKLTVYNIQGRKIKELINGIRKAGLHEVVFDGSSLPSGMYFYRLTSDQFTATKRMLLIK